MYSVVLWVHEKAINHLVSWLCTLTKISLQTNIPVLVSVFGTYLKKEKSKLSWSNYCLYQMFITVKCDCVSKAGCHTHFQSVHSQMKGNSLCSGVENMHGLGPTMRASLMAAAINKAVAWKSLSFAPETCSWKSIAVNIAVNMTLRRQWMPLLRDSTVMSFEVLAHSQLKV